MKPPTRYRLLIVTRHGGVTVEDIGEEFLETAIREAFAEADAKQVIISNQDAVQGGTRKAEGGAKRPAEPLPTTTPQDSDGSPGTVRPTSP